MFYMKVFVSFIKFVIWAKIPHKLENMCHLKYAVEQVDLLKQHLIFYSYLPFFS